MAQVDVVVFGTAAPSGGCGCCSACGGSDQSMERDAGLLKGALLEKYGEAIKFRYVDVMSSKDMKDYPEIQKILNRVHLPLTVINEKPSFHGGLSLEKIAGAVSELLQ